MDEVAIQTATHESVTSLSIVTMRGMGVGMVEARIGVDLKTGLAAAVGFEIGISTRMISGACAGVNARGITGMTGPETTEMIDTTPTRINKTPIGQTC